MPFFCTKRAKIGWFVAVLAGAGLAQGGTYSVVDLGPVTDEPGRSEGHPNGINGAGQVAAVNAVNGYYRALVYNGSWTNLGTLGGSESLASGLNDAAQVAGYSLTSTGATHAFLWTAGGDERRGG